MFLPPPLKSSAAMRAASTEPMPLVSWKMPEMSLSTPTRTTLSEISALAAWAARLAASASVHVKCFIRPSSSRLLWCRRSLPAASDVKSDLPLRHAQHEAVERGRDFDLAGQAARGEALGGGAIQQLIL